MTRIGSCLERGAWSGWPARIARSRRPRRRRVAGAMGGRGRPVRAGAAARDVRRRRRMPGCRSTPGSSPPRIDRARRPRSSAGWSCRGCSARPAIAAGGIRWRPRRGRAGAPGAGVAGSDRALGPVGGHGRHLVSPIARPTGRGPRPIRQPAMPWSSRRSVTERRCPAAVAGDQVVGLAIAGPAAPDRRRDLLALGVAPAYRRAGLATRLLADSPADRAEVTLAERDPFEPLDVRPSAARSPPRCSSEPASPFGRRAAPSARPDPTALVGDPTRRRSLTTDSGAARHTVEDPCARRRRPSPR